MKHFLIFASDSALSAVTVAYVWSLLVGLLTLPLVFLSKNFLYNPVACLAIRVPGFYLLTALIAKAATLDRYSTYWVHIGVGFAIVILQWGGSEAEKRKAALAEYESHRDSRILKKERYTYLGFWIIMTFYVVGVLWRPFAHNLLTDLIMGLNRWVLGLPVIGWLVALLMGLFLLSMLIRGVIAFGILIASARGE